MKPVVFISLFLFSSALFAQHGTSPNGYYPADYNGDTFTGTVIKADAAAGTVTLEYKGEQRAESISVKLAEGCAVPSKSGEPMHAGDIPLGTVITALYMARTEKHDGKREKVNAAIGIRFIEWHGKKLAENDGGKVYPCGPQEGYKTFRVW